MPSTYNGIGTHYYGKKNLRVEKSACESCENQVELRNYETRLWFVVLFIPVIPLGCRQILDYCPRCTCHRALPLGEWEKLRGETTSKALEEFAEKPTDAEAAIGAHDAFARGGMTEDARKLATELRTRFMGDTAVQMYLGAWYERLGEDQEADACFTAALAADPEDPYARRAVAMGLIADGQLTRAGELLACMDTPGEHQEPTALCMLAIAHQSQEEHEEALRVFEIVCKHFPELVQKDKKLRKTIAVSEKALGLDGSIVPARTLNLKPLIGLGVAFAVLLTAFMIANFYLRTHRKLYLVNMLPVPASVRIDGLDSTWNLPPRRHEAVSVPEGTLTAMVKVMGRVPETVEFEIGNGLFERFFGKDVRVLNVARGAVLLWEQTEYTVNADRDYRLIVGQSAIWQRDIHYVFEPFPEQLSTESSRVVKRRLSILRQTPQEMVEILASQDVDSRLVLDYLETHLLALPNSLDLLVSYGGLAMNNNQQERMETFLKAGLDLRPVAVEWHRSYQGLPQRPDTADGLRKTYDALLAESPNDSALHYLRGRVAKDSATRLACFRKAEELDSRNAYPVFARAYELTGLGRFIEAETACEQARKIEPESNKFQVYLRDLRLAVGKVDLVESELARIVQTASGDYVSASLLVALRIRRGDLAGAEAAQEMVLGAVAKQAEEIRPLFVTWAHMSYAYQKGGMDEYARLAAAASETQGASSMRIIHLERGAPAEAVKCMPRDQLRADSLLETSMAWARAGDQAQARACLEEGFKKLCFETDDGARLFALWQADGVKGVAKSITELSIQPRRRRLVCGALAGVALQPLRAKLIGEARRCNFNVEYPHRLVKNCLDAFEQQ